MRKLWLRACLLAHRSWCERCSNKLECKTRWELERRVLNACACAGCYDTHLHPIEPLPPPEPEPEPVPDFYTQVRQGWPAPTMHLLTVSDARILRVPLAAYVAAPARFTEVVTAEQMRETDRWVAPLLEIDLRAHNEMELNDPEWEAWLFSKLRILALHAAFDLQDSTLIVTPTDVVRADFQRMAAAAFYGPVVYGLTLRLLLNGSPVKGSDVPVRFVELDVNALSQEAVSEPAREHRRLIKAFGEALPPPHCKCKMVKGLLPWVHADGYCSACGLRAQQIRLMREPNRKKR